MLDIPSLGIDLLNRTLSRVAENSEDPLEYEASEAIIEGCRGLTGRTEMREAIHSLTETHEAQVNSERLVMHSLMETFDAKGMMR